MALDGTKGLRSSVDGYRSHERGGGCDDSVREVSARAVQAVL